MTDEAKAKQHDLEETPRETSRRLVRAEAKRLGERYHKLREKLYRHTRYLSEEDTRELTDFLDAQFEQTRTIIDGLIEPPEFGFSSDLLEHVDD